MEGDQYIVTWALGHLVTLADPEQYEFEIVYKDEKTPVVKVSDYQVYEQVKKQALSFYKVTGTDNTDRLDPMEGAGFSVYLVSELAGGKYVDVPELTPTIVNEYIKKIEVFPPDKSSGKRVQKVKIYFNFVDDVEIPVISEPVVAKSTPGRRKTA